MKRKSLTFILSIVCLLSQAQHTLTSGRNYYRSGDKLTKQQVEFKDPGSSGRDLHWDFRMIQPINEDYTLDYTLQNPTDSSRICGLEHNTRYYYRQQRDSLQAIGYENSTTYMRYTVPELRMHFPVVYGDTLSGIFVGKGEYCHRMSLSVKGYTRIHVDAEGELLLPQCETVKKALRVRTLRHYTETGKDSVEMTLDTYSWYASGIRYPVFESIKTTLSKKGDRKDETGESLNDSTIFTTSFYYPPEKQISEVKTDPISSSPLSGESEGASSVFTEANYMPNPVETDLQISYKLTRAAKVWFTVHNNVGVPQCSTSPENASQGYNSTIINMTNMITGTYALYVHVDDMVMRKMVVKK